MIKGGEAFSHKCSGTTSIKICYPNFHKEFVTFGHSCSSRQQSCSCISVEDGLCPQPTVSLNQQVNLELSSILSDNKYCRVPSKQVECQIRLGVQECNRLIRLETSSERLSENNQTLIRTSTVDLFASKLCHQLPQYMAWKPDPYSFATDAMQQDWNKMLGIAFSPLSLIGRMIREVLRGNVEAITLVTPT